MRSSLYEQENQDYHDEDYAKSKPLHSITPKMTANKKKQPGAPGEARAR